MTGFRPQWPAPSRVLALSTSRAGGDSSGCFAGLNLGLHVGDSPALVAHNRQRVLAQLPVGASIQWLEQVHGTDVNVVHMPGVQPRADASITAGVNQFCAVMTADCLPVLLCDSRGSQVAAVHAGWRGLLNGVLERTLDRFEARPGELMAWLGPAIGPSAFEVGEEVRAAFVALDPETSTAFMPLKERYLADLCQLARLRLQAKGVTAIYGGHWCTFSDPSRFFSYRRQSRTGRQASLIGIMPGA